MTAAWNQVAALTHTFLARFFESELTTGRDDLKVSFFWLIAALAMPGIAIPWMMSFDWQLVTLTQGWEVLRARSFGEKTFYMGYSLVASGIVTTVAWSSLLPDRRDTLILGALPVRPTVVVAARLAALTAYLGIVALGMHALAAFFFGTMLGNNAPIAFLLRSVLAHFAAATAVTMAMCLSVTAVQGLALALVGPRLFRGVSTVLQVALVGAIALALAWLPMMAVTASHTVYGGRRALPWMLMLPPLWFAGLYEWLLGTDHPVLQQLAARAAITLAACVSLTVVAYALAYRRLMVSVVEMGNRRRNALSAWVQSRLVHMAGREPAPRAAAEFFLTTLTRVERQRFVVAMSVGLAIAWGLMALYAYEPSPRPQAALLAFPVAAMLFLLVGLRLAASLPGDVRGGWLFDVHDLARRHARQALERVLFLLAVVPAVTLSTPVYWRLWGGAAALTHALVMVAIGLVLIELLIWHTTTMPCGQQWAPARYDLGRRWPLHIGFFLLVVIAIPKVEIALFSRPYATAAFLATLAVVAAAVRYASQRHQIVPVYEEVDPVAGILRLG